MVQVDGSGLATAISNGTATVHAATEGVSGSVTLVVEQVPASIQFDREWVAFDAPDLAETVSATVLDSLKNPIEGSQVDWSSSNAGVASVDISGRVMSVGGGTAQITATVEVLSASIGVTVNIWDPALPRTIL